MMPQLGISNSGTHGSLGKESRFGAKASLEPQVYFHVQGGSMAWDGAMGRASANLYHKSLCLSGLASRTDEHQSHVSRLLHPTPNAGPHYRC